MRQAGIIAASGIVALEKMVDRLEEDHQNAKFLAQELSRMDGVKIDLEKVQTNIVTFDLDEQLDDSVFLRVLKENGVLALAQSKNKIRLVTHFGIRKEDVQTSVIAVSVALKESIAD